MSCTSKRWRRRSRSTRCPTLRWRRSATTARSTRSSQPTDGDRRAGAERVRARRRRRPWRSPSNCRAKARRRSSSRGTDCSKASAPRATRSKKHSGTGRGSGNVTTAASGASAANSAWPGARSALTTDARRTPAASFLPKTRGAASASRSKRPGSISTTPRTASTPRRSACWWKLAEASGPARSHRRDVCKGRRSTFRSGAP